MNKEELVTIRTFSSSVEAEMTLGHLKSQGVDAFIKKDDSGGMRPHFQLTLGVDIIVRAKDTRRAEKVLSAMKI
jgi:hypothetical protein